MINCSGLSSLWALSSQLMLEQIIREEPFSAVLSDNPAAFLNDRERTEVRGWLRVASAVIKDFEMAAAADRVAIISSRLEKERFNHRELAIEYRVLRETVASGLKDQLVYRYPKEKADIFARWLVR